jgi:hypothetical protein
MVEQPTSFFFLFFFFFFYFFFFYFLKKHILGDIEITFDICDMFLLCLREKEVTLFFFFSFSFLFLLTEKDSRNNLLFFLKQGELHYQPQRELHLTKRPKPDKRSYIPEGKHPSPKAKLLPDLKVATKNKL